MSQRLVTQGYDLTSEKSLHLLPTKDIVEASKIQRMNLYNPDSILDSLEEIQRYIPIRSEVARKKRNEQPNLDEILESHGENNDRK